MSLGTKCLDRKINPPPSLICFVSSVYTSYNPPPLTIPLYISASLSLCGPCSHPSTLKRTHQSLLESFSIVNSFLDLLFSFVRYSHDNLLPPSWKVRLLHRSRFRDSVFVRTVQYKLLLLPPGTPTLPHTFPRHQPLLRSPRCPSSSNPGTKSWNDG